MTEPRVLPELTPCWYDSWGSGYTAPLPDGRTLFICPVGAGYYSGDPDKPEAHPNGVYLHDRPRAILAWWMREMEAGRVPNPFYR